MNNINSICSSFHKKKPSVILTETTISDTSFSILSSDQTNYNTQQYYKIIGNGKLVLSGSGTVNYYLVGGGGGGGKNGLYGGAAAGGNGGNGGQVTAGVFNIITETTIDVTIGTGGYTSGENGYTDTGDGGKSEIKYYDTNVIIATALGGYKGQTSPIANGTIGASGGLGSYWIDISTRIAPKSGNNSNVLFKLDGLSYGGGGGGALAGSNSWGSGGTYGGSGAYVMYAIENSGGGGRGRPYGGQLGSKGAEGVCFIWWDNLEN